MNLTALQNEVLAHGFPTSYSSRITNYLNDALSLICRRVDYYTDEATSDFTTVAGTASYALPVGWARVRSLHDTQRNVEMQPCSLRDIDRSSSANGQPGFYAMDGTNMHLYPTPDAVYSLELRYWLMPPTLVNGTDIPTLPVDWHHLLWTYAVWMCYEGDDDAQMGQYWQQRFEGELRQFAADARFPSSDYPTQVKGMWESDATLTPTGWTLWAGY